MGENICNEAIDKGLTSKTYKQLTAAQYQENQVTQSKNGQKT